MVKEVKYLGVQVDHQLKWTSQLALTTNKISRGIGILRYAKQYLPLSTVKTMYKSLVEPYFRYCCPVWGNAGVTVIEKLQKLQIVLQNSLSTVHLMRPLYQLFVRFNGPLLGNLLILNLRKRFSDPLKETRLPT